MNDLLLKTADALLPTLKRLIAREGNMDKIVVATDRESNGTSHESLSWLDSKEAARYLRKTANAVRIMVHRGYLRPRKFHNRLYFRRIELDRLLESSLM